MKKISLLLALALVISCVGASAAQYNFIVNGNAVTYDEAPFEAEDKLYVPIRAIFEALGANVFWDGETQTILTTTEKETFAMQVDRTTIHKSNESIEMNGPVKKVNSRTFITLDSVPSVFEVASDIDEATNTVIIMPLVKTEEATEEIKEEVTEEVKEEATEETVEESEEVVEEETTEAPAEEVTEETTEAPAEDVAEEKAEETTETPAEK